MEYTIEGIDAEIVILNGRGFTIGAIIGELGVTEKHIRRVLEDVGTVPYHEPTAERRRPHRSPRIYVRSLIGDVERERRAVQAIIAANTRLQLIELERRELMEVRAEACGELADVAMTADEISRLVGVSRETVRSDLRRLAKRDGG